MHEPLYPWLSKQGREDVLREVKLNRVAGELRAHREGRLGRRSFLAWELNRYVGRFMKLLRIPGNRLDRSEESERATRK